MTHAEFQPGRSDCPGNLTARYQLSRKSGQYTVYTCQQCGWSNAPYRQKRGRQTETPPTPEAHMRTLKLSLNRKAGAPRSRQPEPTADEYDPEPAHREPPPAAAETSRRNGSGPPGPARNGNGRDDRPRNGKQLLGWASSHGQYEALQKLGKQYQDRGRIVDWSKEMVDWAYNDLSRPVGAGWGDGGRN